MILSERNDGNAVSLR